MSIAGAAVGRRQRKEDAEATHDILIAATAAAESTVSAHSVPGIARTGRTGGEFRSYANTGQSQATIRHYLRALSHHRFASHNRHNAQFTSSVGHNM